MRRKPKRLSAAIDLYSGERGNESQVCVSSLLRATTMAKLRCRKKSGPFLNYKPMSVRREDPVLASARREAFVVLAIWLAACIYSIGVSYHMGYGRDVATLTYVFGFPDWIFWGVVVPWTVCTVLSFLLSYFLIRDEDLGDEQSEESFMTGQQPEADHA